MVVETFTAPACRCLSPRQEQQSHSKEHHCEAFDWGGLADFLFPEAYAELRLVERKDAQLAHLDQATIHAAMHPRCNSPSCRKVAAAR